MCLDHPAALPWPYGSSIDYCLYFFTPKHNASKRPNCPWRAKIIVYNRLSTCDHKSSVVCFLGCRQELVLCAQVIFFPGVSGQGPLFLNARERRGAGELYCFRRCANVHLERRNTRLATWGTMEYTPEMLHMKYVYECAQTMEDGVTQHKKWVWLWEGRARPSRHPWHSLIIRTRWHDGRKTNSLAVFAVACDRRKSCVQEKVGWSHLGG